MDGDELKRRFGKRVQALRAAKGLSQEQLADLIGRSVDTVSGIERAINSTRIETAYLLAMHLGVPLRELFDIDDKVEGASAERRRVLASITGMLDQADDRALVMIEELVQVAMRLTGVTVPKTAGVGQITRLDRSQHKPGS